MICSLPPKKKKQKQKEISHPVFTISVMKQQIYGHLAKLTAELDAHSQSPSPKKKIQKQPKQEKKSQIQKEGGIYFTNLSRGLTLWYLHSSVTWVPSSIFRDVSTLKVDFFGAVAGHTTIPSPPILRLHIRQFLGLAALHICVDYSQINSNPNETLPWTMIHFYHNYLGPAFFFKHIQYHNVFLRSDNIHPLHQCLASREL